MILSFFLPKPAPRNHADSSVVQQFERVECIGLLADLGRCLDRGSGEANAWKQIECAGRVNAGHARERIQARGHRIGALPQRSVRRVRLCLPERVAGVARARRAHHAVDADLPGDGRTEADGGHLVEERDDILANVGALKIAAAPAALAGDALGDGVEGDEGHGALVERAEDLLEGRERVRGALVQVGLVDLVGEQDEVVRGAEADELLHRGLVEHRACRVARVDDHERAGLDALADGVCDRLLDRGRGGGPAGLLVEVVGYADALVRGERGGVERVLRDGDEDAGLGARDEHREQQRHARGCASGQEDVVRV